MRVKIRPLLFWLCAALILGAFQFMILNKEQIKSAGIPILLELAPLDPRSLMQGDYMRLSYALEAEASRQEHPGILGKGFILVQPDAHNVARFVALADALPKKDLKEDTKTLLAIPCVFDAFGRPSIQPDSFFFQEGLAGHYDRARYALFLCTQEGECLLTDLADAAGKALRETTGKP